MKPKKQTREQRYKEALEKIMRSDGLSGPSNKVIEHMILIAGEALKDPCPTCGKK